MRLLKTAFFLGGAQLGLTESLAYRPIDDTTEITALYALAESNRIGIVLDHPDHLNELMYQIDLFLLLSTGRTAQYIQSESEIFKARSIEAQAQSKTCVNLNITM